MFPERLSKLRFLILALSQTIVLHVTLPSSALNFPSVVSNILKDISLLLNKD
jgi:hypothetical protein